LVALAEMAMAAGIGAAIASPSGVPRHGFLFGEDQARYLLTTATPDVVKANAEKAGILVQILGLTGGDTLTVAGANAISVAELKRINEAWLPSFMEG
jgi:phosphoribosylformylglycinamidine synthase